MTRLFVTLAMVLFVGACSGSDSGSGDGAGSGQAASSTSGSGGGSSTSPMAGSGATDSEDVRNCLSLVKQGEFQKAVAPCTQALRDYPGNQEVSAALDEAKKGATAAMADTEAAAEAAKDKLGEAAGGMKMP